MLGFSTVESVGSRNKIGYGKRKLTEICDAAKGETWKSIKCRHWQKFFEILDIFMYLFLNDSLFPRLQEYNQFHIYNVPSTKNFICGFLCPCKINKFWDFAAGMDFATGMDSVPSNSAPSIFYGYNCFNIYLIATKQ